MLALLEFKACVSCLWSKLEEVKRMKTSTIAKLGIAILAMMVVGGTASASGGSSYSNAELINVPNGDIDIWSGALSVQMTGTSLM